MSAARPRQDLETALLHLVEAALAGAPANARVPPTEEQRLARLLAAGLRELVRAPLREALQAGYDLGYRAALEAQASRRRRGGRGRRRRRGAAGSRGVLAAPEPERTVLLEVAGFPTFRAVNRFHAAVAAIPGVRSAQMLTFRDGCLCLRVYYPDGEALARALTSRPEAGVRVLTATRDRVRLELTGAGRAPAASAPDTPA